MIEPQAVGKYFEDFTVGQKMQSLGRTVTETDLVNFINMTHIHEELFMNVEYALNRGALGKRILPFALTLCLAEGLGANIGYVHHTLMYALGLDEIRMLRPVELGDTIQVVVEVLDKRESRSKNDRGIVELQRHVINQRGETVMTYKLTAMFRKRAAEQAATA